MKKNLSYFIREAKVTDAPTLIKAEKTIARVPGFLVSNPNELIQELFEATIIECNVDRNGKYLVAEKDNNIIGHGFLAPMGLKSISHIARLTLVVYEAHQGQGVGKGLLEDLITWAKQSPKIEKIELQVRSENQRAIGLYKKMGFIEEGRWLKHIKISDDYYMDDVLMGLWVGKIDP